MKEKTEEYQKSTKVISFVMLANLCGYSTLHTHTYIYIYIYIYITGLIFKHIAKSWCVLTNWSLYHNGFV